MDDVERICESIAKEFNYNSDDISIDLTINGYVSYIEINGKLIIKSDYKDSIIDSLLSLKTKLLTSSPTSR